MIINLSKIEKLISSAFALILPWSIMFATPQLQIGYWGQVEGMIAFNYFCSALVAVLLLRVGFLNKDVRKYFSHPLVLLPSLIAVYTVIASFFHITCFIILWLSPNRRRSILVFFSIYIHFIIFYSYSK